MTRVPSKASQALGSALENVLVSRFDATPFRKVVERVFPAACDARLSLHTTPDTILLKTWYRRFFISSEGSNFRTIEQCGQEHGLQAALQRRVKLHSNEVRFDYAFAAAAIRLVVSVRVPPMST